MVLAGRCRCQFVSEPWLATSKVNTLVAITSAACYNPTSAFNKSATRPRFERQTLPSDYLQWCLKISPRRGTVATSALKAVHAIDALTGAKIGNIKFKQYEKLHASCTAAQAQPVGIDHILLYCVSRAASPQRPETFVNRVHCVFT